MPVTWPELQSLRDFAVCDETGYPLERASYEAQAGVCPVHGHQAGAPCAWWFIEFRGARGLVEGLERRVAEVEA